MSQQKKSGREFTVDIGDDDDDEIDYEDDFDNMEDVHNMTLAELFGRNELRRDERVRRERVERQALRTQTKDNTATNSGILMYFFLFSLLFMICFFTFGTFQSIFI